MFINLFLFIYLFFNLFLSDKCEGAMLVELKLIGHGVNRRRDGGGRRGWIGNKKSDKSTSTPEGATSGTGRGTDKHVGVRDGQSRCLRRTWPWHWPGLQQFVDSWPPFGTLPSSFVYNIDRVITQLRRLVHFCCCWLISWLICLFTVFIHLFSKFPSSSPPIDLFFFFFFHYFLFCCCLFSRKILQFSVKR